MSQLLVIGNPSKRRHKRKAKSKAKRMHARRNPSHKRRSFRVRARRNPISSITSGIVPQIKNGAMGAVGGLANDLLYGFAGSKLSFLPADGIPRYLAKLGTALVIGKIGGMALRGKGAALGNGAVTCVLHDALRAQMAGISALTGVNLGEYITEPAQLMHGYDPGMPVDGFADEESAMGDDMGEYLEQ